MTNERIVRRFLALPSSAMPSAIPLDHDEDNAGVWIVLRDYVEAREIPTFGYRIQLSADRNDWAYVGSGRSVVVELDSEDPRLPIGWDSIDTSV